MVFTECIGPTLGKSFMFAECMIITLGKHVMPRRRLVTVAVLIDVAR